MLTKDLINQIAQASGLTKKKVTELLTATQSVIIEKLLEDTIVPLPGLGTLSTKQKNERTIVHPKTGIRSVVPAKKQIAFHPSDTLKDTYKNID